MTDSGGKPGKGSSRRGRPPGRRTDRVGESVPEYGGVDLVLARLDVLAETLGNNRVSRLLGVSASQPSRWRAGTERPSGDHQRAVIELDYLFARLYRQFVPAAATIWLESFNYTINARPIDALTRGRYGDVLTAVEVAEQGGYD